jgi:hypothetical protein
MQLPDAIMDAALLARHAHGDADEGRALERDLEGRGRGRAHVVRFGRDYPFHHVDRAREAMTARAAHAAGFGPEVKHAAPGVMVTEFLGARTWGEEDLRADPARVARLLSDFHTRMPAEVSGPAYLFWPFHVIRDYARTLAGTRHAAPLPATSTSPRGWRRCRCPCP